VSPREWRVGRREAKDPEDSMNPGSPRPHTVIGSPSFGLYPSRPGVSTVESRIGCAVELPASE